ncbi:hypothetical protein CDL12_04960 [Handroanthus impetiginosus]|uniref:DUF6821 domain-containing protein n=1 Tax=Handroanthus impetiginosus TaxID=429701 RepID=A0A2G9HYB3_9LAMI|nr:hypothetical protein CDL12_04960 [Handroanthus impetiginosus]
MDIVEATNVFQDWELLHSNSDSESAPVSSPKSNNSSDGIDSGGLIQANYFSLDAQNRFGEDLDDDKSAGSDNPSWVDPGLEENPARFLHKDSGEFWTDSSSERSEDRKFNELDGRNELGFSHNEKKEVSFEGIGEILEEKREKAEDLGKFYLGSSGIEVGSDKLNEFAENSQVDVEGNLNLSGESGDLDEEKNNVNLQGDSEVLGEAKVENEKIGSGSEVIEDTGNKKTGGLEKRSVVWWKMPMEFLKYFVFKMSPVWTVSVAAAVMGFVILGRRLYKMKKKTRALEIKVTVDDKKVSQVMSRAARLNEAFSVVKRVPVIRPSLPAVGTSNAWPAMSLR